MSDFFSGLKDLGLEIDENVSVFDIKNEKKPNTSAGKDQDTDSESEEKKCLLDKTFECPVCYESFKEKCVKSSKVRSLGHDTDLRPKYLQLDTGKYDVIICKECGYASLSKFFRNVNSRQREILKDKDLSVESDEDEVELYTYDDAIVRYKRALYVSALKGAKTSEQGYIFLKMAWMFRGKREELERKAAEGDETVSQSECQELLKSEIDALGNFIKGFEIAFEKERFPLCGMNENTTMYLLAECSRRIGDYEKAVKWLNNLLSGRMSVRIKEMAFNLKERIREERKQNK